MIVTPTILLGRASVALAGEARTGSAQRSADAEQDGEDVGNVQIALKDDERRLRAPRPAAATVEAPPQRALAADARPVRPVSPVRHPPIRPRLIRLLN